MLYCPVCKARLLTGRRETCSERCRQRRSRAERADRVARVREILDRQSTALASGADPTILASLAREAQRLLERV